MEKIPFFSVIIPVYNAEKTLRQCVDSILIQNFTNFELILVDDGSIDRSAIICDEYAGKDKRVIVRHKKNGGVSSARNVGLEISQGRWIAFIDSDDFIEQDYLTELNTDADLYLCNVKDFNESSGVTVGAVLCSKNNRLEGNSLKSFIKRFVASIIFRSPCAKFYKRDFIGDLRFPEDMKVAEDSCFVLNYLSKVNTIIQLSNGAYVVRLSLLSASEKYGLPLDWAILSLQHLYHAYDIVDRKFRIGHDGFLSFLGYFKEISEGDWKSKPNKWYGNKTIQDIYRYVWPDLSLKQKIKLIGSFILRK